MRAGPLSIDTSGFHDQTINPYHLFSVKSGKRGSQEWSAAENSSSNVSRVHSRTEKALLGRYRTFTQRSLTEESMNDDLSSRTIDPLAILQPSAQGFSHTNSNRNHGLQLQLSRKRRERNAQLKLLVHRHKINNIVRNFANKISRNNPYAHAVEMQGLQEEQKGPQWLNISGISIKENVQRALDVFFLGVNLLCIYFYTLAIAFGEMEESIQLQRAALSIFLLQVVVGLTVQKRIAGKVIGRFREIIVCYLKESLLVDMYMVAILSIDLIWGCSSFLKLVIVLKLPYLLQRLQKLQMHFISTTYKEQYWSLIKIFLFNFCFAHVLALFLRSIANLNPGHNWMTVKGIEQSSMWQSYIWSYYWAINIMLTVGFGDIAASNHQEALCLIFIQTLSCMVLAYNINCVGSLISNIRSQDLQKSKKYKIFRGLAEKHRISGQLAIRIGNYIEESNNIKKKFNIQEENRFIQALPRAFKKDYLKQANKSIFQRLFFFTNLADKAVQALAQAIQVTITHPQELILALDTYLNLRILKQGRMGYCCRKIGAIYHGLVIDQVAVGDGDVPFLLGMQFITHRRPNFEIKSMEYSIIYGLAYDRLIQSLRKSRGDYEYLCFLRDKSKYVVDQFQINPCKHCKTKHTRFLCPRLHFIPIRQQVINRALRAQKVNRCQRMQMKREKLRQYNTLKNFRLINEIPLGQAISYSTFSQNKHYIVKELRNIQRINTQITHQRTILDYPMVFLNNTAQSIKQELASFLRRENEQDEIWTIALDSMQNYKNYFPDHNPGELQTRFDPDRVFLPKNQRSPFIQYNQKEKTIIKQATYVQRIQHNFESQTVPLSEPISSLEKY